MKARWKRQALLIVVGLLGVCSKLAARQSTRAAGTIEFADGTRLHFIDMERQQVNSANSRSIVVRYQNTNRGVAFDQLKSIEFTEFSCAQGQEQVTSTAETRTGIRVGVNNSLLALSAFVRDDLTAEVKEQTVQTIECSRRFGGPRLNVRRVTFDD